MRAGGSGRWTAWPASGTITLTLSRRQHVLTFRVQDAGMGIPLSDRRDLFKPFHRGRNVSNIPGTGLGLSIVKQFVDLQNGTIDVTSRQGQGTTFTVRLPWVPVS